MSSNPDAAPSQPTEPPTRFRYWVFTLCCATSWMFYIHRGTFAIIKPKLQEEFGWNEVDLAMLDVFFNTAYTLGQFPVGIATDLLGAHLFLGGAIILWSLMMGLQAWAPTVAVFSAVRAAFGAAQSGALSSLAKITRSWFPASVRTSVQGWVGIFFGRAGTATSQLLMATVMIGMCGLSWQTSLYLLGGAGLVLGCLFLMLFRNSPRQHPLVNQAEADLIAGPAIAKGAAKKLTVPQMLRLLSRRSVFNLLALNIQTLFSAAADVLYTSWIPLYLFNVHQLKYKEMGIYSSLPLIGGAIGGALGGWLNDYFRRRSSRWSRAGVGLVAKWSAAGILLVGMFLAEERPYMFCGLLFFVKLIGDWSLASTWGTVTDIGGEASATVFGINNTVGNCGAILAQLLIGYLAYYYGWTPVFLSVVIMYALCGTMWLVVDCTRPLIAKEALQPPEQHDPSSS